MPHLTTIRFPDIRLPTRDAHKLRGYFGNLFREHSPLLHNHYADGTTRHRYPLVQYKVLGGVPTLVALNEGAELLNSLFLLMKTLSIDNPAASTVDGGARPGDARPEEPQTYEINAKHISSQRVEIGYAEELHTYRFETLWMGLNQENYREYSQTDLSAQTALLNKIAVGNVLSFFKAMNVFLEPQQRLMAKLDVQPKTTQFKNQRMLAFTGRLIVNAELPDGIGLGKAVSRGFGTIKKM